MPQENAPPPHLPQPAKREPPPRPVAPARRKPRMQRVKRPVSRNIPPPPSIPLPPPPARKKIQSESDAQVLNDSKLPSSDMTSPSAEESKKVKPPLKPKPAVLPKPAHLAESAKRRRSEPSVTSLSTLASEESPPSSATGHSPSPGKVARGPKPPPPTRTSSLSGKPPQPMKRQLTSPLPSITDVEETDSPQVTKETAAEVEAAEVGGATVEISESKMAVIKSEPPQRPPPPKPRVEEPNGRPADKRKSEPPLRPPPINAGSKVDGRTQSVPSPQLHGTVLFDASTEEPGQGISRDRGGAGSSLKAKGSSLMRSLKKMVKRSESKSEESEKPVADKRRTLSASDEEGSKPPRPSQPPKQHPDNHKVEPSTTTSQQQTSTVTPPTSTKSSPVPKRRTKLQVQEPSETSEPEGTDISREGVRDSKVLPPRPPPPGSSENGVAEGKKDPPSRPPPPNLQDTPQKAAVNGDISPSEKEVENGPKPTPHPRTKDPDVKSQTSSEGRTTPGDLKPIPIPRKSVSPPPSSPLDSPRTPTNFYRATKDYKAQRDTELTFSSGDILIEIDRPSEDFHYGMLDDGTTGLFPVDLIEPFYSPK